MYPLTFSFYTRDLAKCWLFYSAIGIKWVPEWMPQPPSVPEPEEPDEILGREPDMIGYLSGLRISFYYDAEAPQTAEATVFEIEYEFGQQVTEAAYKLEESCVFVPESGFEVPFGGIVRDPEGRRFELSQPELHRITEPDRKARYYAKYPDG